MIPGLPGGWVCHLGLIRCIILYVHSSSICRSSMPALVHGRQLGVRVEVCLESNGTN